MRSTDPEQTQLFDDSAVNSNVTNRMIVEQPFREERAFRSYDSQTEIQNWSLAKRIKRDWKATLGD